MNPMTNAQAIKILEDVTAQVSMNRESHVAVMTALNTLRNALFDKMPTVKPEDAPSAK